MATFEKRSRGGGRHSVRAKVRLKGGGTRTKTFRRLTDAKRWALSLEAAIREGRDFPKPPSRKHTVIEALDRYERDILPRKSRSMMRNQKIQLAWWKKRIGTKLMVDVTASVLTACRDELSRAITTQKRRRSNASVNRYLAALSHVFTIAFKEWEWIDSIPFAKLSKLKEPRERVRYLSDDERKALLKACRASKNQYLFTVVVLALSTGCRREEIMQLSWPSVDLNRGLIVLEKTKNDERRGVPVTGLVLDLLRQHSERRRTDTDFLFPRRNGRKPINLRRPWQQALTTAGIENFKFHDLRHCCASYLAMNGATLPEIAAVLGHKGYDMVRRYAHLTEQHTRSILERTTSRTFQGVSSLYAPDAERQSASD